MKVAIFSTQPYDRQFLEAANAGAHEFMSQDARLTRDAAPLTAGFDAVCVFGSRAC